MLQKLTCYIIYINNNINRTLFLYKTLPLRFNDTFTYKVSFEKFNVNANYVIYVNGFYTLPLTLNNVE